MKKKILTALAAVTATIGLCVGTTFAWTYSLKGVGNCQPDGSFKITWTVTNPENESLQITNSSNQSVVSNGTQVPPNLPDGTNFNQTADGTKAGSFNLTLTGHFPSDQTDRTMSDTVKLDSPCAQPVVPPSGGQGGGTTIAAAPTPKAPTKTPVGPVKAGNGGASTQLNLAAASAFGVSLAAFGLGLRRLNAPTL